MDARWLLRSGCGRGGGTVCLLVAAASCPARPRSRARLGWPHAGSLSNYKPPPSLSLPVGRRESSRRAAGTGKAVRSRSRAGRRGACPVGLPALPPPPSLSLSLSASQGPRLLFASGTLSSCYQRSKCDRPLQLPSPLPFLPSQAVHANRERALDSVRQTGPMSNSAPLFYFFIVLCAARLLRMYGPVCAH